MKLPKWTEDSTASGNRLGYLAYALEALEIVNTRHQIGSEDEWRLDIKQLERNLYGR